MKKKVWIGMRTTERKEWIDYLRGVGILLMMLGHSAVPSRVFAWIYGFHMPLFFVISGYLHDQEKWSERGFRRFAYTRFRNYVIPYFLWCGICFLLNIPFLWAEFGRSDFPRALLQNIGWIITSVRLDGVFLPQNCTPLWFLTALFVSSMVLYWLLSIDRKYRIPVCVGFVLINNGMNLLHVPVLPWHCDVALVGAVFMLLGYTFQKNSLFSGKISPIAVLMLFVFANALIVFSGSHVDMYYRNYSSAIRFILSAGIMSFCLLWGCANAKTLVFRKLFVTIGTHSIFFLGLNYTVNRYFQAVHNRLSPILPFLPDGVRWYENVLSNLVVCLIVCRLFAVYSAKYSKLNILAGK